MKYAFLFIPFFITGCFDIDKDDTSTTSTSTTTSTTTIDTNDTGEEKQITKIKGTITVQVYSVDSSGELVLSTFDDEYGGSFPYGNIFVAAFTEGETLQYHSQTSIIDPTTDGDEYELEVEVVDGLTEVQILASLDFWGEGVIGSGDPVGYYPIPITLNVEEVEDIDITIMAVVQSGGGGCTTVNVSGNAVLDIYNGGPVGMMLLSTSNSGPLHGSVGWTEPEGTEEGFVGAYNFSACLNDGPVKLVGAWDSNYNQLLDPMDKWGSYVSEPDVDANPLDIEEDDIENATVQIPFGEAPMGLVPFVRVSGEISYFDGALSTLAEGTQIRVVALKYQPRSEVVAEELNVFDEQVFEWEDIKDSTTLEYSIKAPANCITYLWAYADTDADGTLNESGEPVGSGGNEGTGRISTSEAAQTGIDIELMVL